MKQSLTFLIGLCLAVVHSRASEYPAMGPDIFDPHVSGEILVANALRQAGAGHKRILVFFGANWCPWTRRLHKVLSADQEVLKIRQRAFVLVYIDANTRNDRGRNAALIEKYGNPLRLGLPVFVILNGDGSVLTTCETQSLAAATDEEVARRLGRLLAACSG